MEHAAAWLIPLIMTTGVGLLVVSTSSRHNQLRHEIQALPGSVPARQELLRQLLLKRSALCRDTQIGLYASMVLFAGSSVLGSAMAVWCVTYLWLALALASVGVLSLLFAVIQLIRETLLATAMVQEQCRAGAPAGDDEPTAAAVPDE